MNGNDLVVILLIIFIVELSALKNLLQEKQRMVVGLSQEIERFKQPEEHSRKKRNGNEK